MDKKRRLAAPAAIVSSPDLRSAGMDPQEWKWISRDPQEWHDITGIRNFFAALRAAFDQKTAGMDPQEWKWISRDPQEFLQVLRIFRRTRKLCC